jgi:hypothetical protein
LPISTRTSPPSGIRLETNPWERGISGRAQARRCGGSAPRAMTGKPRSIAAIGAPAARHARGRSYRPRTSRTGIQNLRRSGTQRRMVSSFPQMCDRSRASAPGGSAIRVTNGKRSSPGEATASVAHIAPESGRDTATASRTSTPNWQRSGTRYATANFGHLTCSRCRIARCGGSAQKGTNGRQ